MGDNDDPLPDGGPDRRGARSLVVTAFGEREAGVYADQFEIYHGNANPELARKIAHWLDSEPGQAEVFQFANENIFVTHPGQRPREGRLPRPAHVAAGEPVDHGAPDHDRRLQAGVARAGSRPSSRTTPTAGPTRRTSRGCRSPRA